MSADSGGVLGHSEVVQEVPSNGSTHSNGHSVRQLPSEAAQRDGWMTGRFVARLEVIRLADVRRLLGTGRHVTTDGPHYIKNTNIFSKGTCKNIATTKRTPCLGYISGFSKI